MSRLSALADTVHTLLDDATVLKVIGQQNKGRNLQRRRIHWYRMGGEITFPKQAGGRVNSAGDDVTGTREPAVWMRLETVTCHLFAESEETLDVLLDSWIVALDNTAPNGSVQFTDYSWDSTDADEFAKRTPMVAASFVIKLPVVDEIGQLVEITAEELTAEFDEGL